MQHFYDGQIRRYITQMVRLMSNFSYKDGKNQLHQIPVIYGDLTRQVANIIRDNSENKIPSAPRISIYVTGLDIDRTRTADSTYVSKMHVREREFDSQGNEYLNTQGKNYTVERLMPSPYKMTFQADIWSTNTDQKLQILEQILVLFNPSLDIQTTDNFVDWTSLTVVDLIRQDWSNRTIPVGTESEIDVSSLIFETPIYISAPVKVKKLGVITKIITSVFNEKSGDIDLGNSMPELMAYSDVLHPIEGKTTTSIDENGEVEINSEIITDNENNNRSTNATTYKDYGLYIENNVGKIIDNGTTGTVNWRVLTEVYPGDYVAGLSQIKLRQLDTDNFLVGTFALNPLNETEIIITWDSDSLPTNTIISGPTGDKTTIDAIIDPQRYIPVGKTAGQRFLILGDINPSINVGDSTYDGPDAWKNNNGTDFVARENDIIEWDGNTWTVVFDANNIEDVTYTTNLTTNIQYKWNGIEWIQSWEGMYSHSNWHIYLDG